VTHRPMANFLEVHHQQTVILQSLVWIALSCVRMWFYTFVSC